MAARPSRADRRQCAALRHRRSQNCLFLEVPALRDLWPYSPTRWALNIDGCIRSASRPCLEAARPGV